MMFKSLLENKNPLWLIGFHVLLGLASTLSSVFFIAYFYIFILSSINFVFNVRNVNSYLSIFLVYLVSFEILARMAKTSPIIPYEMGKYVMFFSLLFGIFFENRRGLIGIILLLCLLPAVFYDYSGLASVNNKIFNVVGPINMALAIIYFYKNKFTFEGFKTLIRVMIYPCISVLSYVFFKTPDFDELEFTLGANFETTGGFGSNQVSTILGLGMFLVFLFWVNRWKFSSYRWLDFFLLCFFAFQGLLSFSRGGMIGGALAIGVFFIVIQVSKGLYSNANFPKVGRHVIFASVALLISFFVANVITDGVLLLRYQGETAGTMAGAKEKTLNAITTGRLQILQEDIALFKKYPIGGVGVAASKYLRANSLGIVAHVEMSRLLSEHGLLGIFFIIGLLFVFIPIFFINKNPLYKAIVLGFYLLAVYSTFHAATRTFISPLLLGLSCVWIVKLKKQQPSEQKAQDL